MKKTRAATIIAPSSALLHERDGNLAVLTLNRPAVRNSLSEEMLTAFTQSLEDIANDKAIRAVVLAAEGPVFCAGHDLKELTVRRSDVDGGRAYFRHIMTLSSAMMQQIIALPQPVIAAVQGTATAAGCQLVASCDIAIASSTAEFATPGVDIGLFCSTPMVALSRNVPRKQAMEMLLTGRPITAERAEQIGLINRAVPPGRERIEAIALAKEIGAKPEYTLKLGKQAFYRQLEMSLTDAYAYASEIMTENLMARDSNEGICAFLEKRPPKWDDNR
jgi:enoyl-CoA hydratase/carnithine racemase